MCEIYQCNVKIMAPFNIKYYNIWKNEFIIIIFMKLLLNFIFL